MNNLKNQDSITKNNLIDYKETITGFEGTEKRIEIEVRPKNRRNKFEKLSKKRNLVYNA